MISLRTIFLSAFFFCTQAHAAETFQVQVMGKGDPMILIPGIVSSGDVWKSTVIHYQERYQCHVLTLAGFAGVPPLADDAFLDHVKNDLIDYIKTNQLQKPVMVGHGTGGFLALWVASTEPQLVGKLIIVDALPYMPAAHYPTMSPQMAAPFASKQRDRMLAQPDDQFSASQKIYFRTVITDTATANAASVWGTTSDKATVAEVYFEMQTIDLRGEIVKITQPVLVLATWKGMKEQTHEGIAEVFKAQYALLRNYQLAVMDNSLHFIMLDDPQGFFESTDYFLSQD